MADMMLPLTPTNISVREGQVKVEKWQITQQPLSDSAGPRYDLWDIQRLSLKKY